ncbi:MAG: nitronate monooxygenase [Acetobacteraceae bacterium]|nr:nitronate monooxygenase [Acetobacteraceae bacterium]
MPIQTALTQRLAIAHPVIQAPMGGGATTTALTAAVCNAGGLGCIAAAYLSAEQIARESEALRSRTSKPYGINLFAPVPHAEPPPDPERALDRIAPFFTELGLPAPAMPAAPVDDFDARMAAVLDSGAAMLSFTSGLLPAATVSSAKERGMMVVGTATTVEEAVALEASGCDAIVAQGSEAGAHRGTFLGPFEAAMVGTIALVPQIVDAVRLPVIASGGIMDGRGLAAALALGASAVQSGTAFLTCDEAGIPESYKRAVLEARDDQTRITRAFSGRAARGIVNRFMEVIEPDGASEAILPYPLQNILTRALRNEATKRDQPDYLSLWAGQGTRMTRRQPAAELVARFASEAEAAIGNLTRCIVK